MDVRPAGSAERRDLHLDADRPCIDRIAGRMTQSEGTNGVSDWSERFEVSIDGAWTGIFTRLEFAYSNDVEREREASCSKNSGKTWRLENTPIVEFLYRMLVLSVLYLVLFSYRIYGQTVRSHNLISYIRHKIIYKYRV